MEKWERFWLVVSIVFEAVVGLVALYFLGRALILIAPISTVLFVLIFTYEAAKRGYGTLATTGIVLYTLSWLALDSYGYWPSVSLAGLGVLTWLAAVLASFGARTKLTEFFKTRLHFRTGNWS